MGFQPTGGSRESNAGAWSFARRVRVLLVGLVGIISAFRGGAQEQWKGEAEKLQVPIGQRRQQGFDNSRWESSPHALQDRHMEQKPQEADSASSIRSSSRQQPLVPPGAAGQLRPEQQGGPATPDVKETGVSNGQAPTDSAPGRKTYAPLYMPPEALTNLHLKYDPSYKAHILLAAPSYGGMVTEGFALSMLELSMVAQRVPSLDLSVKLLPGDSLITRARNTLVALFLGSPQYTHFLFIDTDITFSPDNVLRLLEMSKKKPIVAAPYPKKGLIFKRMKEYIKNTLAVNPKYEFTDEELQNSLIDFVFNSFSENDESRGRALQMEDGFVRVDNAGTGFLMIRRDVLETMADFYSDLNYVNDIEAYVSPTTNSNFYGLFDTMIDPISRRLLSEDYAFCRRAQALGFEIWMDLYADLKHFGTFNFDGDFKKSFMVETAS